MRSLSEADPGRRRAISEDRAAAASWFAPTIAALLSVQLWSALSSVSVAGEQRLVAAEVAAVLCSVLAVFGLRSVPLRRIVWPFTLLSGVVMLRFGLLVPAVGLAGSWRAFLWLSTTTALLFVVPRRIRPGSSQRHVRVTAGVIGGAAVTLGAMVSLVLGVSVLVGPRVSPALPVGSTAGDAVDRGDNFPSNPLDASNTLDMTRRPRLSDRVVMTVRSPVASFWRTETYDTWSGSVWSRSFNDDGFIVGDGRLQPAPDDLAARAGEEFEQEFRMEAGYTTALPAAPSPVAISTDRSVGQRPDGTMVVVDRPVGRGGTYSVRSRQIPTTFSRLRTLGTLPIPSGVASQYAESPIATPRTVALARGLTEDLESNLDKVEALIGWMDSNTTYSLDAPLSPQGSDVVDHFLFESRSGWCEQIASSLVVMARIAGVPARLATGFVPGNYDDVSQRFIVREREAHAWAEVWFPEVGWVQFDPTATVPLAGDAAAEPGAAGAVPSEAAGLMLLVLAAATMLGPPGWRLVQRIRAGLASRSARRRRLAGRWDAREEASIESVGRSMGRERGDAETLMDYVDELLVLGAPESLAGRAARVEEFRYGRPGQTEVLAAPAAARDGD